MMVRMLAGGLRVFVPRTRVRTVASACALIHTKKHNILAEYLAYNFEVGERLKQPYLQDCKTIKTHKELYDDPYDIFGWPLGLMKD